MKLCERTDLLWVWASGASDGRGKAAPGGVEAAGGRAGREGVLYRTDGRV